MVNYSDLSRQYQQAPEVSVSEPLKEREKGFDKKNQALSMLRSQRALKSEFGRNLPVDEEVIADQLSKEMSFGAKLDEVAVSGGMTTGVMPIRIQIPTIGQVYRFAKQIVSDEPLIVEATYIKDAPFTLIKLIVLILILYALYRKRDWLKRAWDAVSDWYRKRLARFATPLNLVIVVAILFLFSLFFLNLSIAKLLFFLLLIAVIYYAVHYLRIRKERKKREIDTDTKV
jgi:hypothetical protein